MIETLSFVSRVLDLLGTAWKVSLIVCLGSGLLLFAPSSLPQFGTLRGGTWGAALLLAFVFSGVSVLVQSMTTALGWTRGTVTSRWRAKKWLLVLKSLSHWERHELQLVLKGFRQIGFFGSTRQVKSLETKGVLRRVGFQPDDPEDKLNTDWGYVTYEVEEWAFLALRANPVLLSYDKGKANEELAAMN